MAICAIILLLSARSRSWWYVGTFSSPKAALLLVSTKHCDLWLYLWPNLWLVSWPVPTSEVRDSRIPVTLLILRVKPDKFDWFRYHSIVFAKPIGTGISLDLSRGRGSWSWLKGARPLGTRLDVINLLPRDFWDTVFQLDISLAVNRACTVAPIGQGEWRPWERGWDVTSEFACAETIYRRRKDGGCTFLSQFLANLTQPTGHKGSQFVLQYFFVLALRTLSSLKLL